MTTIEKRTEDLREQLNHARHKENVLAKANYLLAVLGMAVTLVSSAVAGIGGIFLKLNSQITGGLALIPGIISVMATAVNLEGRANLHRRKRAELQGLIRRLDFELSEQLTAGDLAKISTELTELDKAFEKEFEKLRFIWRTPIVAGESRR